MLNIWFRSGEIRVNTLITKGFTRTAAKNAAACEPSRYTQGEYYEIKKTFNFGFHTFTV